MFSAKADNFIFSPKSSSILIETDKAIYQPGQTSKYLSFNYLLFHLFISVKFRAIFLSSDLLPLNQSVSYEIKDPKDNVILLKKNQKLTSGVVSDELNLHPDSIKGNWKITFSDVDVSISKHSNLET